jgi:hypothetical protein
MGVLHGQNVAEVAQHPKQSHPREEKGRPKPPPTPLYNPNKWSAAATLLAVVSLLPILRRLIPSKSRSWQMCPSLRTMLGPNPMLHHLNCPTRAIKSQPAPKLAP